MENQNEEQYVELDDDMAEMLAELIGEDFERQFVEYVDHESFEEGYGQAMKYGGFFTALIQTGMTPREAFELTHEIVISDVNKEVLQFGEKQNRIKELENGA